MATIVTLRKNITKTSGLPLNNLSYSANIKCAGCEVVGMVKGGTQEKLERVYTTPPDYKQICLKKGSAAIYIGVTRFANLKLDLFILLQMKLKNVVTTKQEKLLLEKVT